MARKKSIEYTRCRVLNYNRYSNVIKFDYDGIAIQTTCKIELQGNPYYIYAHVDFDERGFIDKVLLKSE